MSTRATTGLSVTAGGARRGMLLAGYRGLFLDPQPGPGPDEFGERPRDRLGGLRWGAR